MASGKRIGEFSFKVTAFTFTPSPATSVLGQMHCEGTATGFGTVLGTFPTVSPGQKSGT